MSCHSFFYYLAKLIIFKGRAGFLYFFLEGGFKSIYLRERNCALMWFQRNDFLKYPPLHCMGEALGILYNQTFFSSGLEYLFTR